jgi:UDP-N-acetylglucosamine transferase subunit ALG13
VEYLDTRLFDDWIQKASGIIGHAGMGTITMALDRKKPLLVMPRFKKYGEVVNDHQVAIVRKFSELGHILAVYDVDDLLNGIRKLKDFVAVQRKTNPQAVADRIHRFLNSL